MIAESPKKVPGASWTEIDWELAEKIIATLRFARLQGRDVRLNVSLVNGQVAVYRVKNEELYRKRTR